MKHKVNKSIRLILRRELKYDTVTDSMGCKFSEDGSLLVSTKRWGRPILMWHTEELLNSEEKPAQPKQIEIDKFITTVAANSHKGHIFSGDSSGNIMVHDAQT